MYFIKISVQRLRIPQKFQKLVHTIFCTFSILVKVSRTRWTARKKNKKPIPIEQLKKKNFKKFKIKKNDWFQEFYNSRAVRAAPDQAALQGAFCGGIYHAKTKLKILGEYCKILHIHFLTSKKAFWPSAISFDH